MHEVGFAKLLIENVAQLGGESAVQADLAGFREVQTAQAEAAAAETAATRTDAATAAAVGGGAGDRPALMDDMEIAMVEESPSEENPLMAGEPAVTQSLAADEAQNATTEAQPAVGAAAVEEGVPPAQ